MKDNFIDTLFKKGKAKNILNMEIYMAKKDSLSINIYNGEIEKYIEADEIGLSVSGIYNGVLGYSYTEKLFEDNIDEIIENIIRYAEINNKNNQKLSDFANMSFLQRENHLNKYSEEEKINYLIDLEKKALNLNNRIKLINNCNYEENTTTIFIKNTEGFKLKSSYSIGSIVLSAISEENESMQTGSSNIIFEDLKEEYKDYLLEGIKDAVGLLNSDSIRSGNYDIILRNNVAADIFSGFLPVFYSNKIQENLSLMKNKIDTVVSSKKINLLEDPFLNNGKYYRVFDDEGTITKKKYLIKEGILKNYLYNNKTSLRDNTKSTGNGYRQTHKSSIEVIGTNFYIEKGIFPLKKLIEKIGNGILIVEVDGLHAGINEISGEFSLISKGYLIKNGQVTRPISQITISGNFYKLLLDISELGNDMAFSKPYLNYFGCPSMIIKKIDISGNY